MVKVNDVAAYFIENVAGVTTMKLQKLCDYAQAWTLATTNQRLFNDRFEVDENGPVIGRLFRLFKGLRYVQPGRLTTGDASALSCSERDLLDQVIAEYGDLSGDQLSVLTHRDRAWLEARAKNGGYLSEDGIRETYQDPAKRLNGLTALEIAFGGPISRPQSYDREAFAQAIMRGPSAAVVV